MNYLADTLTQLTPALGFMFCFELINHAALTPDLDAAGVDITLGN